MLKTLFFPITFPLKLVKKPLGKLITRISLKHGGDRAQRRHRANSLAASMLSEFHRLGFTRKIHLKKRKTKRERVKYEYPLLLTHDELWCPIDLRKLPTGVRTDDLRDESVLRSIEDRCHTGVRVDYLANGKLCFVLRLGGNKFPETFSINSFKMRPDAPMLAFSLGMSADGEHSIADLTDLKHLLVVGATGGGKTTFIHAMLYWFITRNGPDDLELWLIDLKNGAELGRYDTLLHSKLNPNGIVKHLAYEPEKAVDTLSQALKEIERRNGLMRQHSASNLDDLAGMTGIHLRRIVVVVDEVAMLMLNKNKIGKYSTGAWGENLITRIASLGRSAGVHLVIASQVINKEVLSSMILANFENRLVFSVADWRKSQLALETSDADGLPVGRAIFRKEAKTAEYQTCLIKPQQTRLELARIKREGANGGLGQHDELARFVRDAKLLLSIACERLQGDFSRRKLLAEDGIRGMISEDRFNEIAQRLERDGILEPGRSRTPRRVSRGYFGRPHLLDVVYNLTHHTSTTDEADDYGTDVEDEDMPHQDGETRRPDTPSPVVCGADVPATCQVHDEDADDLDLPSGMRSFLDSPVDLGQPEEPPAPKKRKRKG